MEEQRITDTEKQEMKDRIKEAEDKSLVEDVVKKNYVEFDFDDVKYKINIPKFNQIQEMNKKRLSQYTELVEATDEKGNYIYKTEADLIKLHKKRGIDVELEMSTNDVEKTFNYLCSRLLKEQDDERAKYTNVARAWSVLKSAIRVWFQSVLSKDSNYYYEHMEKLVEIVRSAMIKEIIDKMESEEYDKADNTVRKKHYWIDLIDWLKEQAGDEIQR